MVRLVKRNWSELAQLEYKHKFQTALEYWSDHDDMEVSEVIYKHAKNMWLTSQHK